MQLSYIKPSFNHLWQANFTSMIIQAQIFSAIKPTAIEKQEVWSCILGTAEVKLIIFNGKLRKRCKGKIHNTVTHS